MSKQKIFWIDLFCGAGGTTTGIHLAGSKVVACVNHDAKAIASHEINHPDCVHFTEDIRSFTVVLKLKIIVAELRKKHPNCLINIWASLECTNYSKAKGGMPRNGDSRTLANHLFMYIDELSADYLYIENVREFMAWGPLDVFNKPVSKDKGKDYLEWISNIQKRGYSFDYKLLNSADFGAYTSRERFFGQFAKKGLPIAWPDATHIKKISKSPGLFEKVLEKWKAVRDVLSLEIEGQSIFDRKKPLVDKTLERIYAGLIKFSNEGVFIKKYFSGKPEGKVISVNGPAGTIKTKDGQAVVKAIHLNTYYGNGGLHSLSNPSPTLTTKDRVAIIDSHFIDQQYGNSNPASVNKPSGSLTTVPKLALVNVKHWLLNPQYDCKGSSIENPCFTLIARMDKKPPYIVSAESGEGMIVIYENDSPIMVKIKEFMAEHGIIDIKMRMLLVEEMLKIQGFPDNYFLGGTKTDQKKFIGNSVVPLVAQKLVESNAQAIKKYKVAA